MAPKEREQEIKKLEKILTILIPLCHWEVSINKILFMRHNYNLFVKELWVLNKEKRENA